MFDRISKFLESEYFNFVLWAPFVLATGMLFYFGLRNEPNIPHPSIFAALFAAIFAGVIKFRRKFNIIIYTILTSILLIGFGFMYANAYTRALNTTMLMRPARSIVVTGTVSELEYMSDRTKVWIKNAKTEKYPEMTMRITLADQDVAPKIGDVISVNSTLFAPSAPDAPGAFDFARWAYFNNMGAVGFANENIEIVSRDIHGFNYYLQSARNYAHKRIAPLGLTITGLVDALILGHNKALSLNDSEIIKAAGLSHILSISGLHMTLIGGWLFAFFFMLFKMVPIWTRRHPARTPAMILAWIGLLIYLLISGSRVATMRAFFMTSLGFLALMSYRSVFSLRILCLIFGLLLLINPHFILEAGFQMSLSAVIGLIYFFRNMKFRPTSESRIIRIFQNIWIFLKSAFLTSVIAGGFTMPFVAYHFHTIPLYGLLGNMICLPFFTFAIMPLALIGTILILITGWSYPLILMGHCYDIMVQIATWISNLPYATLHIPTIPGWTLMLFVFSVLILMLVKSKIKHIGWGMIAISVIGFLNHPKPILYSTPNSETLAVMTDSGHLRFNKPRSVDNPFVFESWASLNAQPYPEREMRRAFGSGFDGHKYSMNCLDGVCIYNTPKWSTGIVFKFVPLFRSIDELCYHPDLTFTISSFGVTSPKCWVRLITPNQIGLNPFVIYENGDVEIIYSNRIWHPNNRRIQNTNQMPAQSDQQHVDRTQTKSQGSH